jgi:hypothetical protein
MEGSDTSLAAGRRQSTCSPCSGIAKNEEILPTTSSPLGGWVVRMAGSSALQLVLLSVAVTHWWGHLVRRWGLLPAVPQAPQRAAVHCSRVWGLHRWQAGWGQRLVQLWGRPAGLLYMQQA